MGQPDIPPALTPEQWSTRSYADQPDHFSLESVQFSASTGLNVWRDGDSALVFEPRQLVATMALANHALPDDDPRKITRAMVDALHDVVDAYYFHDETRRDAQTTIAICEHAIAALRALLPPE